MFSKSIVLLTLASSAFATVFVTGPTAASTFTGGQEATITWQDDGVAPSLKDFGISKVSIYAGNAQQQTSLQLIVDNVDVSTTQSIKFTPDPTIGPDGNNYFIRFESVNFKDPNAPQFPALAFSAKYTMNSMTGKFSDAVQAQINGQSTAPLAGPTSAASSTAASASKASQTSSTAGGNATTTGTRTPSSSATAPANSAVGVQAGWIGIVLSAVVGVAMF